MVTIDYEEDVAFSQGLDVCNVRPLTLSIRLHFLFDHLLLMEDILFRLSINEICDLFQERT